MGVSDKWQFFILGWSNPLKNHLQKQLCLQEGKFLSLFGPEPLKNIVFFHHGRVSVCGAGDIHKHL